MEITPLGIIIIVVGFIKGIAVFILGLFAVPVFLALKQDRRFFSFLFLAAGTGTFIFSLISSPGTPLDFLRKAFFLMLVVMSFLAFNTMRKLQIKKGIRTIILILFIIVVFTPLINVFLKTLAYSQ